MLIGYNTNGLAHHELFDGLELLARSGYRSVALTIDHNCLSPRLGETAVQIQRLKNWLEQHQMASVVETGARFLLDPTEKHAPTLLDPDPERVARRIDFYRYCIDVAAELNSDCVSLWSGIRPNELTFNSGLERLVRNLAPVLDYAESRDVTIGFEPEPGMLIDTTGRFERLLHLMDSPRLKMTLDIGHLFCLSEVPLASYIERWADWIVNVHIEDMQAGVHEHLMFGEGQIHFPPVIDSLLSIGYRRGVHVELSRHSHQADKIVPAAYTFLNPIIEDGLSGGRKEG
jgi:L-ribulose-5-phosphate 3-epimerase